MSSCVGAVPVIQEIEYSLVYRNAPATNTQYESLHIFMRIADEDGIEDIDEIYILHDDETIYWKLTSEMWDRINIEQEIWIGSQSLRLAHDIHIPRGVYRIQIYDKGGELAQETFSLPEYDTVENVMQEFPSLSQNNNRVHLSSAFADNIVRLYRNNEDSYATYRGGFGAIEFIDEQNDTNLPLDIAPLLSISEFYIYSFPFAKEQKYYFLVGPVRL